MDYTSSGEEMGKNVGDDLAEGKPTLPLLHAMEHGNGSEKQMIRDAIESGNGMENLDAILATMHRVGSLDYTINKANQEADKAVAELEIIPDSEYKTALIALAYMSVNRTA
jgi:octaprenyl-diphosphate synthase